MGINYNQIFVNANRAGKGMKMAFINISLSMFLAAVKIVTGFLGHSYALITDGIESLVDIFSSTVVWGGLKIGVRPPDSNHPFGYGKAESLAAMIVSGTLLGVAIGIAIQSVKEILTPHHTPALFTLFVLVGVILVKELMYRFLLKTGEEIDSNALKADAWHSRSDALTSLAAFIGISISLIGGKGYESADDWAALFASGVIFFNGFRLLKSAVADIMDAAVSLDFEGKVKSLSKTVPGVIDIEKCRIRKSGLDFFIEIHIIVDGKISVAEGHRIGHEVKQALFNADLCIIDVVTHVEPVA
ncbi:MAG: cation diffusion facilitator family transporter [Candidatus Omnitrophota bacterium]|nr:cation diffusion facilitator family transporter [Candidatus Omnitrophota bacterium]